MRQDQLLAAVHWRPRLFAGAAMIFAVRATAGELPQGFARLSDIAPGVAQDMRYAGPDNFTGAPLPGYRSPQCWLRAEAAKALARAQAEAHRMGFDLVVHDCYRPRRAVAAFVEWSRNADQRTKRDYYPNIDKRALFAQGYIAEKSGHSTGLAVDLGVRGWNFGTPFDFFDQRSWTRAKAPREARLHRERLVALMRRHGFVNYPREWWHFSFSGVKDATSHDAEIE
jgi:D-alanyl-D-alanine dipeptidase